MIDINTLIESGVTDFNITIKYSDLVLLGDRLVERILDEVCPIAADNAVEKLLTKAEVMPKMFGENEKLSLILQRQRYDIPPTGGSQIGSMI